MRRRTPRDCARCRGADAVLRCGRCKLAMYCTKACQREHWKEHREACAARTTPAPPQYVPCSAALETALRTAAEGSAAALEAALRAMCAPEHRRVYVYLSSSAEPRNEPEPEPEWKVCAEVARLWLLARGLSPRFMEAQARRFAERARELCPEPDFPPRPPPADVERTVAVARRALALCQAPAHARDPAARLALARVALYFAGAGEDAATERAAARAMTVAYSQRWGASPRLLRARALRVWLQEQEYDDEAGDAPPPAALCAAPAPARQTTRRELRDEAHLARRRVEGALMGELSLESFPALCDALRQLRRSDPAAFGSAALRGGLERMESFVSVGEAGHSRAAVRARLALAQFYSTSLDPADIRRAVRLNILGRWRCDDRRLWVRAVVTRWKAATHLHDMLEATKHCEALVAALGDPRLRPEFHPLVLGVDAWVDVLDAHADLAQVLEAFRLLDPLPAPARAVLAAGAVHRLLVQRPAELLALTGSSDAFGTAVALCAPALAGLERAAHPTEWANCALALALALIRRGRRADEPSADRLLRAAVVAGREDLWCYTECQVALGALPRNWTRATADALTLACASADAVPPYQRNRLQLQALWVRWYLGDDVTEEAKGIEDSAALALRCFCGATGPEGRALEAATSDVLGSLIVEPFTERESVLMADRGALVSCVMLCAHPLVLPMPGAYELGLRAGHTALRHLCPAADQYLYEQCVAALALVHAFDAHLLPMSPPQEINAGRCGVQTALLLAERTPLRPARLGLLLDGWRASGASMETPVDRVRLAILRTLQFNAAGQWGGLAADMGGLRGWERALVATEALVSMSSLSADTTLRMLAACGFPSPDALLDELPESVMGAEALAAVAALAALRVPGAGRLMRRGRELLRKLWSDWFTMRRLARAGVLLDLAREAIAVLPGDEAAEIWALARTSSLRDRPPRRALGAWRRRALIRLYTGPREAVGAPTESLLPPPPPFKLPAPPLVLVVGNAARMADGSWQVFGSFDRLQEWLLTRPAGQPVYAATSGLPLPGPAGPAYTAAGTACDVQVVAQRFDLACVPVYVPGFLVPPAPPAGSATPGMAGKVVVVSASPELDPLARLLERRPVVRPFGSLVRDARIVWVTGGGPGEPAEPERKTADFSDIALLVDPEVPAANGPVDPHSTMLRWAEDNLAGVELLLCACAPAAGGLPDGEVAARCARMGLRQLVTYNRSSPADQLLVARLALDIAKEGVADLPARLHAAKQWVRGAEEPKLLSLAKLAGLTGLSVTAPMTDMSAAVLRASTVRVWLCGGY